MARLVLLLLICAAEISYKDISEDGPGNVPKAWETFIPIKCNQTLKEHVIKVVGDSTLSTLQIEVSCGCPDACDDLTETLSKDTASDPPTQDGRQFMGASFGIGLAVLCGYGIWYFLKTQQRRHREEQREALRIHGDGAVPFFEDDGVVHFVDGGGKNASTSRDDGGGDDDSQLRYPIQEEGDNRCYDEKILAKSSPVENQ